jgi:hypothetical protein
MNRNWGPSLVLVSCVFVAVGCSSASGGSGGAGAGAGGPVGDLSTECAAYCAKQAAAGCRNSVPATSCQADCDDVGKQFPQCTTAWNSLNHCMANTTLSCDAQGNPAVGMECFPQVNAYGSCLTAGDAGH